MKEEEKVFKLSLQCHNSFSKSLIEHDQSNSELDKPAQSNIEQLTHCTESKHNQKNAQKSVRVALKKDLVTNKVSHPFNLRKTNYQ